MDFESLMLKKLGENKERESPMSTSLNPEPNLNPAISINQGQKKQAPAKAPKRRPLATMKPRVRCAKSPCDFAGKQGPEMNKHMSWNTKLSLNAMNAISKQSTRFCVEAT